MADDAGKDGTPAAQDTGGGVGVNAKNNADIQNSGSMGDPKKDAGNDDKGGGDDGGINSLDTAMSVITDLRKENAGRRVENKELKERVEKLETGDKDKKSGEDVTKLQGDLDSMKSDLKAERLVNKFTKVASKAGADVDLAFAFLKGSGQLDGLDPDETGFEKEITTVINAAMKSNSKLKAAESTTRAGSPFPGGNTGKPPSMDDLLRGAVAGKRVRI